MMLFDGINNHREAMMLFLASAALATAFMLLLLITMLQQRAPLQIQRRRKAPTWTRTEVTTRVSPGPRATGHPPTPPDATLHYPRDWMA